MVTRVMLRRDIYGKDCGAEWFNLVGVQGVYIFFLVLAGVGVLETESLSKGRSSPQPDTYVQATFVVETRNLSWNGPILAKRNRPS